MSFISNFNSLDIALAVVLAAYAFWGFLSGTLRGLGGTLAILASAFLAVVFAPLGEPYVTGLISGDSQRWIGAHTILFAVASLIIGFVLRLIIGIIAPKPTLGDSFGGLIIGVLNGLLLIALLTVLIERYPPAVQPDWMTGSVLRPAMSAIATAIRDGMPAFFWDKVEQIRHLVR